MEKWQREQLDEAIKERGIKYLNDTLNMVNSQHENDKEFINDILQIDREEAIEIIEEYTDLANMMRYTFGLYRSNVDYFNQYSLQINSIVSTSLLIEQHIHDLTYNKDLASIENEKSSENKLNEAIRILKIMSGLQKEIFNKPIPENYTEAERLHFLHLQDLMTVKTDGLLKDFEQHLAEVKEQEEKTQNEIKSQEKSEYFIGTLSNDEDFYYMFRGTILRYVINDIIEGVRNEFFKEYKINIINRIPEAERVHCLKASSYNFTTEKITKLMQLALLNHKKNIINDKILSLFDLFINLKEKTKQENYNKIIKKHIKKSFKEILKEKYKTNLLTSITISHAEKVMQEMGWFDIEQ